jgi:hypothetical protein
MKPSNRFTRDGGRSSRTRHGLNVMVLIPSKPMRLQQMVLADEKALSLRKESPLNL